MNYQLKTLIPQEVQKQLLEEYVIVVPNQLYKWHPVYKDIQADKLDNIYIKIFDYLVRHKLVNNVLKARNKAHRILKMTFVLLTEQYLKSSHK